MKRYAPAAQRNIGPIADVLAHWLPPSGLVLEVASGSGEHGLAFARRFSDLQWQPTDPDEAARASITAWQKEEGRENFLPPMALDAASAHWPVIHANAVLAINMVHISPWAATLGLFAGAGRLLGIGGVLILYGPYLEAGVETAPSNLAFDHSLKARNKQWGLRHVDDMCAATVAEDFVLDARQAMPANNLMLLFRKIT